MSVAIIARWGLCQREYDGKILEYIQYEHELRWGFATLLEIDPEIISVSDADCLILGIPINSKVMRPLPGQYDINSGYNILSEHFKYKE